MREITGSKRRLRTRLGIVRTQVGSTTGLGSRDHLSGPSATTTGMNELQPVFNGLASCHSRVKFLGKNMRSIEIRSYISAISAVWRAERKKDL